MLDSIYARLTQILRNVFDEETLVARPDLTADHVEGWDSFAQLRFIVAVEKEFSMKFSARQMSSLANVGDLAQLVAAHLAR
jgi:acyl carrier protein